MYHNDMDWATNITNLNLGIFRTINGNSDEMIGVGRCMKAGFQCSRVDITNGRYDAIVDSGKLLRLQIKGTGSGSLNFTGGGRSGQQISRQVAQRTYKYTEEDCDVILGVNSHNGDCYLIPIRDAQAWGTTKSISKLEKYKEQWDILIQLANGTYYKD